MKQFKAWNLFKSYFQLKNVTAFRTPIYSTRMHLVQQVLKPNQDQDVFSGGASHLFMSQTFVLSGWVVKAMSPISQRCRSILRAVSSQMQASHYCWILLISRWTSRWCWRGCRLLETPPWSICLWRVCQSKCSHSLWKVSSGWQSAGHLVPPGPAFAPGDHHSLASHNSPWCSYP